MTARIRRLRSALVDVLIAERDRWALWLPVLMGTGIGVYFALSAEPWGWWGGGLLAGLTVLGFLIRRHVPGLIAVVALGAVALGFAAAQARTAWVMAPMIEERLGPVAITARVVGVELLPDGRRLTLDHPRIDRLRPDKTPEKIRVRLRGAHHAEFLPGDWLELRAVLMPPPAPSAPGAFDFQRQAFFNQVGAVGFAVGGVRTVARPVPSGAEAFWLSLAELRQTMAARILERHPGEAGTLTAALMTGDRGPVPDGAMNAMRDSGLAHLLAISGMNMALVVGLLYVGLRSGLALIPPLALRYPIKKWAAILALIGGCGYALLVGATVPTMRAFLMYGLVFMAVLLDRDTVSLRGMAWTALAILLVQPESLMGASFQMSFAATIALIVVYEAQREQRARMVVKAPSLMQRLLVNHLAETALMTLVATAATTLFAFYHFNRLAVYALPANLIAGPVTTFWVMPLSMLAYALMPFGLEDGVLTLVDWGMVVVLWSAYTFSGWPGSVVMVPAMPTWALAAASLGGLWLCLWRRPWRWAGVVGVAVGLAAIPLSPPPDLLVDEQGKLVAMRDGEGRLNLSSVRAARFTRDAWLRRNAQAGEGEVLKSGLSLGEAENETERRLSCDILGCVLKSGRQTVAVVKDPAALGEECYSASVIVSLEPVRRHCPGPHTIIDRFDLWRNGTHALWLEADGVRVASVGAERGERPWVVRRAAKAKERAKTEE